MTHPVRRFVHHLAHRLPASFPLPEAYRGFPDAYRWLPEACRGRAWYAP